MIHKRKPNRLDDFNYSKAGFYFITICSLKKGNIFGRIQRREVILSKIGHIADNLWREIPDHYDNVDIDFHIIMPDHIHGIIIIKDNGLLAVVGNHVIAPESVRTGQCPVPTENKHFSLLSKVIKSFKNAVTTTIRSNCRDCNFRWQRSFYDHAIRNEKGLTKIREYIINNPIQQELTGRVTDKRLF